MIDWYRTGSAGLIQTISMFAHHTWGAAIVGLIATIGWVIQGVGNMYYYRQVRIHYIGVDTFRAQLFIRRYTPTIQPRDIQWKRSVLILFSWQLIDRFCTGKGGAGQPWGQSVFYARLRFYYMHWTIDCIPYMQTVCFCSNENNLMWREWLCVNC